MRISGIAAFMAVVFVTSAGFAGRDVVEDETSHCASQATTAKQACERANARANEQADAALLSLHEAQQNPNILPAKLQEVEEGARRTVEKLKEIKRDCEREGSTLQAACTKASSVMTRTKTDSQTTLETLGRNEVLTPPDAERVNQAQTNLRKIQVREPVVRDLQNDAEGIRSRTVPAIQAKIDELNSTADQLAAQRAARTASGDPPPAAQSAPQKASPDQKNANGNPQTQMPNAMPANAQNPAVAPQAAAPSVTAAQATGTTNPAVDGGISFLADGSIKGDEDLSGTTAPSGTLIDHTANVQLAPLEKNAEATPAPAAGDSNLAMKNAPASAVEEETTKGADPKGLRAASSGSGSSGGSSGGGWSLPALAPLAWSKTTGAFAAAFGDKPDDANKKTNGVDLGQFLPGQKRGPASLAELGIHGPNVNFFSKVNERYHSLKNSLEP